ncbi:hypothetical protein I4F81_008870 [Pyropia yezoensis]|uniref:Uncharacterized protein n=1 Tax=Pyropia yezoensis TaxID=2788 RepID=A0ACC3C8B7_PYRYE|nr:hypothetical protein I4F81_008870 [Neopyropia yezoensis]
MALAARHPATPMLGMEIRERVTEFCAARLAEARAKAAPTAPPPPAGPAPTSLAAGAASVGAPATPSPPPPPAYANVGYVRTNAMKYLPNYIPRGTLTKLFFCYPDPHFKRKKHRQRIISGALLAEYAYVLVPGGVAYAVTDVYTLSAWMFTRFDAHPLFMRLTDAELAADPMVAFVRDHTDEAQRVERNGGTKFVGAWRRVPDPVDSAGVDGGAEAGTGDGDGAAARGGRRGGDSKVGGVS